MNVPAPVQQPPLQAIYPILGTSSAFIALVGLGFIMGGGALMAMM